MAAGDRVSKDGDLSIVVDEVLPPAKAFVEIGSGGGAGSVTSVSNRTTNGNSSVSSFGQKHAAFVSKLIASTAAGATIKLYGTNTNSTDGGVLLATFTNTLAASGTHEDGTVITGAYAFVYAVVSGVSGTITSLDLDYSI